MLSLVDGRPGFSRREFLRIGTLGLGGLSLPQLLGARAVAAGKKSITTGKSVIFLFQFGGPSQFETFDPKMDAPDGIRSVNGEVATSLPGVTFGSKFPQLASRANAWPWCDRTCREATSAITSSVRSCIAKRRSAPTWAACTRGWQA